MLSNSKLCEASKCLIYSTVRLNHTWWMSMLFHRRGLAVAGSAQVTFGDEGGIMTTAGKEFPYPFNSQAKTRDESSRRGE